MGRIGELYAQHSAAAERVEALIEAQQKKLKGRCMAYAVGEQLKEMSYKDERVAALLEKDLEGDGMGIEEAEKKIAAFAKANKGFATLQEAEGILRDFYGLGSPTAPPAPEPDILNLTDFL